MSQYAYRPLPDSKNFTRLLSIISVDDTITCALEDFPIDDPPPYHAVSYCWGTEPACEKIYVGSESIALTLHLLEGIRSLHKQANPPKLWIDAICINQVDNVEKSGQIPLMGDIYRGAEKVLVWLGRGSECSDLAMSSIPELREKLSLFLIGDINDETRWQEVGLPLKDHPVWNGIKHILSSDWFSRLWPLQEVTLAKEVDFFSGNTSTDMTTLIRMVLDFVRPELHLCIPAFELSRLSRVGVVGLISLAKIREKVPYLSTGGDGAFYVLTFSNYQKATEPLDYVYGVLGMLGEDIKSRITVDYSERSKAEFWKVYADLGTILLRQGFYTLLGMVDTKIRLPQLPSWCPNWSSPVLSGSFNPESRAGHGRQHTPFRIVIHDQARIIQCAGFILDHIVAMVPRVLIVSAKNKHQEALEMCERIVQDRSTRPIEENIPRIARTLVANLENSDNDDLNKSFGDSLVQDYTLAKYCSRYLGRDPAPRPLDVTDEVFKDAYNKYRMVSNVFCRGRSFFVTEGGFIGLCPKVSRVGDTVCVMFGANFPFVLRERPRYPGVYQLIGEAYVDGIMDGESMESRDPANDRYFIIS